ncbi:MAG: hypothetical protein ABEJ34_04265 [Haloferacaceae archaeon]
MSNRVEELESRVAELQAAVDGLTEELVETRERLRKLEDDADGDGERREDERVTPAGDDGRTTADEGGEPDTGAESEADPDPDSEADAEGESGDDESSSGTDEIIIA